MTKETQSKPTVKKEEVKKAEFAKVPLSLLEASIKQILNNRSEHVGTTISLITQLQKCEKF